MRNQKEVAINVGRDPNRRIDWRRKPKSCSTIYAALVDRSRRRADALAGLLEHEGSGAEAHAEYMRDSVVPAMTAMREVGDAIEVVTPHELWPLPTYREMLFVK